MSNNFIKGFVSIVVSAVVLILIAGAGFGYVTYKDQQKVKNTQEGFKNMNLNMDIGEKNNAGDSVAPEGTRVEQSTASEDVKSTTPNNTEVVAVGALPPSLKSKGKFLYNLMNKDKVVYGKCAESLLIVSDDLGKKIQEIDVPGSTYYCSAQRGMVNVNLNLAAVADPINSKEFKLFSFGSKPQSVKLDGSVIASPIISPKGNYVAVGVLKEPSYYPEVHIYNRDGTLYKKLTYSDTYILGRSFLPVFWSEDERILFIDSVTEGENTDSQSFVDFGATAQVFSLDINSGKILKTKVAPLPVGEVASSPDGRYILFANSLLGMRMSSEADMLFKIKLIDVDSGLEKVFISDPVAALDTMSWSPDGKRFLFVKGASEINVGDIESGSYKKVSSGNRFVRGVGWVSGDRIVFIAEDLDRKNQLFSIDIDGNNKVMIAEADIISIIGSAFGGGI